MEFLTWHYRKGLQFYVESWSGSLNWVIHYFSLTLLLKTLFSPWKRLIIVDKSAGFNLQQAFQVFSFNLVSRGIGAVVRIILFCVGLVFILFTLLGGISGLLFWIAFPFFGLSAYYKYKGQPKIFVSDIMDKLKLTNKKP